MAGTRAYIARNAPWLISAGVAAVGYAALELLKASQLFQEGAIDVPWWAWLPIIITSIGGMATLISVFMCKSRTARIARFVVVVLFIAMMFNYTVGFVFFG